MLRVPTLLLSAALAVSVVAGGAQPAAAAPPDAAPSAASSAVSRGANGAGAGHAALTGFPDATAAGFHHLALIYHGDGVTESSLTPYVGRVDGQGNPIPGEPLFDAFLMLSSTAPSGVAMDYGASIMQDWLDTLDLWFGSAATPGGDLATLENTVDDVAQKTGTAPEDRQVVIMMPWLDPDQHDFGDLGDGHGNRDLAVAADREAVADWFASLVEQRFRQAGYSHLKLWGLYRMREDVTPYESAPLGPGGAPLAASEARGIKDVDPALHYLFIPYFSAPGWDQWSELGFDLAMMQPGYAFRDFMDGGRVDAGRLDAVAHLAAEHGLGVEIEVRGCQSMPTEQAILQGYLAAGGRYGYQSAPNAYYLGAGLSSCGAVTSSDPAQRASYDRLADYVSGRPVPSPDVTPDWNRTDAKGDRTWTASSVQLPAHGGVRIDLDEPTLADAWRGSVLVQWRVPGTSTWSDAAWSVRGAPDTLAQEWQSIAVPLPEDTRPGGSAVVDLRVVMDTAPDSPVRKPQVTDVVLDPALPPTTSNALADAQVTVEQPTAPPASYPDSGGTLTDGVVSTTGWNTPQDVGWDSDPGQGAIVVDLGAERDVTRVRLFAQGGSDAGVNWPLNASVLLGSASATTHPEGTGAEPSGLRAIPFSAPVVTGAHPSALGSSLPVQCGDPGAPATLCTNKDGTLDASTGSAVRTRYLTVFFSTDAWTMLSELQVFDGGTRLPIAGYTLVRQPNQSGESYADDGMRLVDGHAADDFMWQMFSGWTGDQPVTLRFQLPAPTAIPQLQLWSADLPAYGITPPTSLTLEATTDGTSWAAVPAALTTSDFGTAGVKLTLVPDAPLTGVTGLRLSLPGDAASWQWHMLSEISVPTTP